MNFLYANNISIAAGFARSAQVENNAKAFKNILNTQYREVLIKPLKIGNLELRMKESSLIRKTAFFVKVIIALPECHSVYSRNLWLLVALGFFTKKQLTWEMHDAPNHEGLLKYAPNGLNIICISMALETWLKERGYGFKTMVAHDGISLDLWNAYSDISKKEQSKLTVVHTGSAFPGRGLEILFELAKENPQIGFHHFGGTKDQLIYWKENHNISSNVSLNSSVSHDKVMRIQRNASILLLPMTKNSPIWWCTSPMKLFEYMASGSLIMHTGIGSITEVLTEDNSVKIDLNNLSSSFEKIVSVYKNIRHRGELARREVYNNYLWEIRVKKILDFLEFQIN